MTYFNAVIMHSSVYFLLLLLTLTIAAEFCSKDDDVVYHKTDESMVVYPPCPSENIDEQQPRALSLVSGEISIGENDDYRNFALKLLKKIIFPHSFTFNPHNTIQPAVRSVYYKNRTGGCSYVPYIWATHWYDNCQLDVFQMGFDRGNTQACTSDECVIKFSTKITTSVKAISSWKVGEKMSLSMKIKDEVPLLGGGTTGLEISDEYGRTDENMITQENAFEMTVKLHENQVGIPTVLIGGVKCDLSLLRLGYIRNLDVDKPPYEWYIIEKMEPCDEEEYMKKEFDVHPDPFKIRKVVIPLYDESGEIIILKYIQLHNVN